VLDHVGCKKCGCRAHAEASRARMQGWRSRARTTPAPFAGRPCRASSAARCQRCTERRLPRAVRSPAARSSSRTPRRRPQTCARRAGLSCPSYICDCRFLVAPAP
jgi:hypothetical protein